jgi:lia operon protein LiaG
MKGLFKMKKGFLLFSIVLWTIIAITVVGLMIFGVKGGFKQMSYTQKHVKDQDVQLANIQNIVVDGSDQTVEIRKTSGYSIKISQYGSSNTRDERLFLVSTSEDAIHIYFDNDHNFYLFNFNINEKLVIEIPEDFKGNLDVKTSSGNVRIEDEFALKDALLQCNSGDINIIKNLTAGSLYAKTSSGNINVSGNITIDKNVTAESSSGKIKFNGTVTAKNLNAETSSGDIQCAMNIIVDEEVVLKCSSGRINLDDALTARDLNAKTNSGKIRLGNVNVENYSLRSSSGGIQAESVSGTGEAETSSGNIQLSLKNPKGNIKLTSSSGSIKIELEPSLQFTLDAQTNSGGIHTNFATMSNEKNNKATAKIGDNPTVSIIAKASSGGIHIEN